ncbi:GDSL esterase/lipase-like protein [Tanacetum coccineum]
MAYSSTILLVFMLLVTGSMHANGCYTSIISFGDSLADTGNLKQLSTKSDGDSLHFLFPPYGETFFHKPTGRFSNGRLIIDFIAETLGLPLIPPSLGSYVANNVTGLGQGVNYAVAGGTALEPSFLETKGVYHSRENASLGTQLGWFKESLASICSTGSGN